MRRTMDILLLIASFILVPGRSAAQPLGDPSQLPLIHNVGAINTDSILFHDEFNGDLSQWQTVTGSWSIVDSKLFGIGTGGGSDAWIYAGDTTWTDYELSARSYSVQMGSTMTNSEFVVRSTGHWKHEYRISVFPYNWGPVGDVRNNRIEFYCYGGNTDNWGEDYFYLAHIPDTIDVKIRVVGSSLAIYINGKFACWDSNALPYSHGRIGLGTLWYNHVRFDDVIVRRLDPLSLQPRLAKDSIDLHDILLNSATRKSFWVYNTGPSSLTIDTIVCRRPDVAFETAHSTIQPGDSCLITVVATPTTFDRINASCVIAFREPGQFVSFQLVGHVYSNVAQTIINVPQDHTTIQQAIDAAKTGDTILVADGKYREVIDLKGKNIVLASHFLMTRNPSHIKNTVIDGYQQGTVVTFSGGESASCQLTGFTITGGASWASGGIACRNASPQISYLILRDNVSYAGVESASSPLTGFTDTGGASRADGGVARRNVSPRISNLISRSNASYADDNWYGHGAGLYFNKSKAELTNILITNNMANAGYGGAFYVTDSSSINATHITLTNNASGVIVSTGSLLKMWNSIVWEDIIAPLRGRTEDLQARYCDIKGGWTGEGNIDVMPRFIDKTGNDFRLSNFSPCVGAGTSQHTTETDLDNRPRPFPVGTAPDIGAYENDHSTPFSGPGINAAVDTLNFGDLFVGDSLHKTLIVRNPGTFDLLIFSATSNNPVFHVQPRFAGIDPEERDSFAVSFTPTAEMNYTGILTLISNAANEDTVSVILIGRGLIPPVMVFQPDSVVAEVYPGTKRTVTVTLKNDGESNLYFNILNGSSSTNRALQFDGIDDHVLIPNSGSLNPETAMTIEAWVSPSAVTGGQDLVSKDGEAFDRQYLLLAGSNGFRPHVGTNAGFQYFDGSIVPQSNVWHHVAMTFDGAMLRLFVNGIPDGTMSVSGNAITTNQPVRFGGGSAAGDPLFFAGRLDEVRIWNVARSQEEIRTTMDRQLMGTEPGLAAYWSFDEGSGESVYDLSVHGNHGWFVGSPLRVASTAPMQPWWLSWTCDSLVCAAHASRQIKLTFDATTKNDGVFLASLIVTSNDPLHRRMTIPLKMVVTTAAGAEDKGAVPTEYSLEQNYPNPFNPTTTIRFSLPHESNVRLTIYNLLGQKIEELVNEQLAPGVKQVTWEAKVPTGVYLYRLDVEGSNGERYSETRRMAVLK